MDSMTVVRVTDHNMFLKRNSCGSSVAAVNISSSSAGPGNCSCSPSLPVEVDGVGNGRVSLPDSSLSTPASEEGEKVDETVDELSQEESSDSSSDGGSSAVFEADASNTSDGKMGRLITPAFTLAVSSFLIFTASSTAKKQRESGYSKLNTVPFLKGDQFRTSILIVANLFSISSGRTSDALYVGQRWM